MYRLIWGKISSFGNARTAGRTLLAEALSPTPLPEIIYGKYGKPGFTAGYPLWFNISHSGDDIVLLLSDEGEVGCDIEALRPRKNTQRIADAIFSPGEQTQLTLADDKLTVFWQIWTRKEAMLKQAGAEIWQIAEFDSCTPAPLFLQQMPLSEKTVLALCTPTPLSAEDLIFSIK
ncbi:4'-phosphopantetheinyl transferase AcpT [Pseudocitrobacter cyperus]|uniref:4'-phosphopantetheinyl transferase AcpT n=1 Tax=Pseudocitrobacter cyperus TaxID=3112843 RepID=A0ABV0HJM9_9ENTR